MKKAYILLTIIIGSLSLSTTSYSQNQNTDPDSVSSLLVGSWDYTSSCGYGCCGYFCSFTTSASSPPTKYYVFHKVNGQPNKIDYNYFNNNALVECGTASLTYSGTIFGNKWNIDALPGFTTTKQRISFPITNTISLANNCPDCTSNELTKKTCSAYYSTSYDSPTNSFTLTIDSTTNADASTYQWSFGDGSTSNLPTPSHTYSLDTTYIVCLTITMSSGKTCSYCHKIGKDYQGNIYRTGGFKLSVVNPYLSTKIESTTLAQSVEVFPNPTAGKMTITIPANDGILAIYNVIGEKVYQESIKNGKTEVDLGSQPNGVYFINVETNNGTINKKFVLSK